MNEQVLSQITETLEKHPIQCNIMIGFASIVFILLHPIISAKVLVAVIKDIVSR